MKILSRDEMKNVMGGNAPIEGGGTCCAHNQDWSWTHCGISSGQAQQEASSYAQNNGAGNHGLWCCSSCN